MVEVAELLVRLTYILGVPRLSLNWDNEYSGYVMCDFLHCVNGNKRV
jgi:hypothetical protein